MCQMAYFVLQTDAWGRHLGRSLRYTIIFRHFLSIDFFKITISNVKRLLFIRKDIRLILLYLCCCCLPCNHCSNWTCVVEEILAFGNRLRSTNCREFNYYQKVYPTHSKRTLHIPKCTYIDSKYEGLFRNVLYSRSLTMVFSKNFWSLSSSSVPSFP